MTQNLKSQGEEVFESQTAKIATTARTVWELDVGKANDKGEKNILAKIMKYKFAEEGDNPLSFDSEASSELTDGDCAFVYRSLIGRSIAIVLDSDDAVINVSGLDELWKDLSSKASGKDLNGCLSEARIVFSDTTVAQSLRRIESIAPKKAVPVGEKWTADIRSELPLIGEVAQRFECSLKAVETTETGMLVVVQFDAAYEGEQPRAGKTRGQEIMVNEANVTEKGAIRFDLVTGTPVAVETTFCISAVLASPAKRGRPLRISVKSTNEVNTTIVPRVNAEPQ